MGKTTVADMIRVSESVMSMLWNRFRKTSSPAEQYPGWGGFTTADQDRQTFFNC